MILSNDIFTQERFGLITASKVYVLFPLQSAKVGQRTYAKQLANQRFFGYYDETGTWQTEHGNANEYHAEMHYLLNYGDVGERPKFIADEANQLGGSPDWVGVEFGIDWKCPTTLEGWLSYLHDGISREQYYQCQMYMALTGLKKWKIAAYLTETNRMIDLGLQYPVPQEQRMLLIEIGYEVGFKAALIERAKPVIEMRDKFIEVLKYQFKK